MGKPLSNDPRSRVVQIVASGLTRRKEAAQAGVSAASAVRWVEAVRVLGSVEPKPQGVDTRSSRIELFSGVLLAVATRLIDRLNADTAADTDTELKCDACPFGHANPVSSRPVLWVLGVDCGPGEPGGWEHTELGCQNLGNPGSLDGRAFRSDLRVRLANADTVRTLTSTNSLETS